MGRSHLLFDARYGRDGAEPVLLRAAPDLFFRDEPVALAGRADTDIVDLRPLARRGRVDVRAALRAEGLHALAAAFGGLDVDRRLARDPERAVGRRNRSAERRAGQLLAVGAVADRRLLRVDLGFIGDVATMASTVDFHGQSPLQ